MNSITDFFTPTSLSNDGAVKMLEVLAKPSKNALYVVNNYGVKLLKVCLKNEKGGDEGNKRYAQLKIIRYGFKRAILWANKPTDPQQILLRDDVEITYHGSVTSQQTSKIHLKAQTQYKTLMDQALELPVEGIEQPAPLFALELGCFDTKKSGDMKIRSGHVVTPGEDGAVRFEFYILSKTADLHAFFNSTYLLNLFFTQDYLSVAQRGELKDVQIIAPIQFLPMGDFYLLVKRAVSQCTGQPELVFYNNSLYQDMWLNRKTGWTLKLSATQLMN